MYIYTHARTHASMHAHSCTGMKPTDLHKSLVISFNDLQSDVLIVLR